MWSLRGAFGDVELELHPAKIDAAALDVSVRELRKLVYDFKYREPSARRVLGEVYARLHGLRPGFTFDEFDTGDPRADRIGQELVSAARAGVLVARPRKVRAVVVPLDTPAEEVLGPDSGTTHIYKIRILDDTGEPVSGAKVTLEVDGSPHAGTTNGQGEFTLPRPNPGYGKLTIENLNDLRDKLWPQWSKPLADEAPQGDQISQAPVNRPIAPLTMPSDWIVTLVLTRPPIWRVRMVGMLFDGDKCFLLPQALDGVRSVVAMHQAHPAAKVLIVGHEGGDEVEGSVDLALGRAKILAGYLTSKADDWMPWFGADKSDRQRWGAREVQLMLSALAGPDGQPYYDGSAPGVLDDRTVAALKAFQAANGLTADGKPSSDTRKALVNKYMAIEDTSLVAGAAPVAHGCTGHEDDTITQHGLQPDDRRLEVLFFDTEIKPPPSGDTSDGASPEYPAWRSRLVETLDFEKHGIHVQIVDMKKEPMPLSAVHLDGPAPQDTTTDEHGFVTFWGLLPGDYTVSGTSRTGIPVPAMTIAYPTAKTILGARVLPSKGHGAPGSSVPPVGRSGPSSSPSSPAPAPTLAAEGAT
jgi:Putative peptidoglycan binding domain